MHLEREKGSAWMALLALARPTLQTLQTWGSVCSAVLCLAFSTLSFTLDSSSDLQKSCDQEVSTLSVVLQIERRTFAFCYREKDQP